MDEVRRHLKMTIWNYATLQRLFAADRSSLIDLLRTEHPYLSPSFLELAKHADQEVLARCFADEVRRQQVERTRDFDIAGWPDGGDDE